MTYIKNTKDKKLKNVIFNIIDIQNIMNKSAKTLTKNQRRDFKYTKYTA